MATYTEYPLLIYQVKVSGGYRDGTLLPGTDWLQFWIRRSDLLAAGMDIGRKPTTGWLTGKFREALGVPCSMKYIGQGDYGVPGMQLRYPPDVSSILNVVYATAPRIIPIPEPPVIPINGNGNGNGNGEKMMNLAPVLIAGAALLLLGSKR